MTPASKPHPRIAPANGEKFFIPEQLTVLYYAPIYQTLSLEQRTRYNQLFGLFVNEFILLCEMHFSKAYTALLNAPYLSERRRAEIAQFLVDEACHTQMFTSLNQEVAPELYTDSGFHFIELPIVLSAVARIMMRFPRLFPFFFVLVYLQEEKLLFYAERYAREAQSVDERFLLAHARHLEDESGHIGLDLSVIEELWQRASNRVRRFNAWLLRTIFGEFFTTPKRSGIRIIEQLIKEFPALAEHREELGKQLLVAGKSREFLATMYSREIVPGSVQFFETYPEFKTFNPITQ